MDAFTSDQLIALAKKLEAREKQHKLALTLEINQNSSIDEIEMVLKAKKAAEAKRQNQLRLQALYQNHISGATNHLQKDKVQPLLVQTRQWLNDLYAAVEEGPVADTDGEAKAEDVEALKAGMLDNLNLLSACIVDTYSLLGVSGSSLQMVKEKRKREKVSAPTPSQRCRCSNFCAERSGPGPVCSCRRADTPCTEHCDCYPECLFIL